MADPAVRPGRRNTSAQCADCLHSWTRTPTEAELARGCGKSLFATVWRREEEYKRFLIFFTNLFCFEMLPTCADVDPIQEIGDPARRPSPLAARSKPTPHGQASPERSSNERGRIRCSKRCPGDGDHGDQGVSSVESLGRLRSEWTRLRSWLDMLDSPLWVPG